MIFSFDNLITEISQYFSL
ncbi:MAG: hypothetical protein ACMUEM_03615 [Flavobacteriales bacterium AspAUS03]